VYASRVVKLRRRWYCAAQHCGRFGNVRKLSRDADRRELSVVRVYRRLGHVGDIGHDCRDLIPYEHGRQHVDGPQHGESFLSVWRCDQSRHHDGRSPADRDELPADGQG